MDQGVDSEELLEVLYAHVVLVRAQTRVETQLLLQEIRHCHIIFL